MGATSVIRGKLLELFDGDGSRDKATVIVEARRPPAAPPRSAHAGVRTSPRELLPAREAPRSSRPEAAVPAESMRAVEAALEDLGVISGARRNERSGSFVVELTRDQLESLSRHPAVQAIRADTLRRKLS